MHGIWRRRGWLTAGALIAASVLGWTSLAIAKSVSSIKLTGPSSNKIGQSFAIKMSGYAAAPANRVVAGEQTSTAKVCAGKYTTEYPRNDYYPAFGDTVGKNKRFKGLTVAFSAQVPGKHALCAYVINSSTYKTYAHAEITWTNHPVTGGHLQPSPVGSGQCQAQAWADGSVTAQIAIENTTCTVAKSVEAGAHLSKGAPYSKAGFACKATAEGPGSPWSSAWAGTYYAYSCSMGAAQVAFTWGTHYT